MFFAYFLIIVGIVFLLKNLGLLPVGTWEIIWPALLIAWGLSMIFGRHRYWWGWWWPRQGGAKSESSKETQG